MTQLVTRFTLCVNLTLAQGLWQAGDLISRNTKLAEDDILASLTIHTQCVNHLIFLAVGPEECIAAGMATLFTTRVVFGEHFATCSPIPLYIFTLVVSLP